MNSSQLKIIAIIGMVLDHIAWILFPSIDIFHLIGKISFPIFCYMISEGYFKTRNKKKYLLRLLGIAIVSQIPFIITFRVAFGQYYNSFNTIFDLLLGLISIWMYDKSKIKSRIIIIIIIGILALLFNVDGDIYGVLIIFIFYKYHDNFKKITKGYVTITLIYLLAFFIYSVIGLPISQIITFAILEPILLQLSGVLISIILLKFYNGEKGKSLKLLFYSFYPLHLMIIYAIKIYLFD
ncbi:TraX protein [Clostridium saccharobutylicum]|uniref:TraX family protein n=1 Tax=Clostridium saccharobutylicum TaxID=169679 RepID=UPI000983C5D3|nr:TraX family protein [Clostridium saccharobutylicum]AQS10284.1 TraX protein [Clostridium saccharobutylicum]MBC2436550.1 hypothetical protein [Clostridium saccharobutylicum]NSB87682.1 hypothetical protein [Clostridium saccharobutylicum]NYC31218.1 hypothetical protein [Clostridium saccharobutylicum]OOM17439.1 TraX protein [Clostridium saccharobutylicum]